jgi:uncharacterized membrane protein (UPF0136 family)
MTGKSGRVGFVHLIGNGVISRRGRQGPPGGWALLVVTGESECIGREVSMWAAGQRECVALPIRLMLGAAKIYFIVFGILTIAGGIVGYVKAGSVVSIIAGSISGILLLVAAWLMPDRQAAGLIVALIVSVLLAGQFVPRFFSTHKVMPAGLMSVLSVLGIVVAIAAWLRK